MGRTTAWLLTLGILAATPALAAPTLGGPLPGPLPLFPADSWWNLDISTARVDPDSDDYIAFINDGGNRRVHPDFGGEACPGCDEIYGIPYIVVDGTQPKLPVDFFYDDESDGVDHATGLSFPFYPIPAEAITQPHWVEGGAPGDVDERCCADRHILVVDRDNRHLYELWNCWYDGSRWQAGSGAFFDLDTNDRRPDGWTSADAAGLAILPGLVRHDEVYGSPDEIAHAFRVTVRATNDYVYPASHQAGNTAGALPMGARLRLRSTTDISSHPPELQKVFRAMMRYGLIVADNGSDMYVSGAFDLRWDNGILNPAFHSLHANDFEVIELGWNPPVAGRVLLRDRSVTRLDPLTPTLDTLLPLDAGDTYLSPVASGDLDPAAPILDTARPLHFYTLEGTGVLQLIRAGTTVQFFF